MVTGPSIEVLGDEARPDVAERHETKYVFTGHDPATLRQLLLRSCRPILHAGPVSTVRSVYFDDPVLSTCRASLEGVGVRHKTRLRWYDRERFADRLFLEIKWRRHRVCGKHRLQLAGGDSIAEASWRAIHGLLLERVEAQHQATLARDAEPVLLVEYRREHFVLHDGSARITLDYHLRFCPQLGCTRPSSRFAEPLPGVVLVECKSAVDAPLPPRFSPLIPLRARHSRFSKYVVGCRRLGYIAPL
jgi:hypothetical protein